jgi:regulatory protein
VARQICLRLLTVAPRTRAQLATALRRRGVPDQAADTVLERFADVQLIDDAMFARAWVETRHHGRGLARRALAAELRQRGVEAEDIRAAVDTLDPAEEYATARALVERRLPGTRRLDRPARFRRLMGMLARKGYPQGVAYRAVREALENEPAGVDPEATEPNATGLGGAGLAATGLGGAGLGGFGTRGFGALGFGTGGFDPDDAEPDGTGLDGAGLDDTGLGGFEAGGLEPGGLEAGLESGEDSDGAAGHW